MAYPALSMTSECDRRCGSRQSASPNVHRSAGSTGCNGAQTATCSFVLVPHERGSPGGDEDAGWNRDGRGRTTVLAFCMTPPWGAPLAGSRMVNGSEREKHAQAIMTVWKRQVDCGGDERAKIKAKLMEVRRGYRARSYHLNINLKADIRFPWPVAHPLMLSGWRRPVKSLSPPGQGGHARPYVHSG